MSKKLLYINEDQILGLMRCSRIRNYWLALRAVTLPTSLMAILFSITGNMLWLLAGVPLAATSLLGDYKAKSWKRAHEDIVTAIREK